MIRTSVSSSFNIDNFKTLSSTLMHIILTLNKRSNFHVKYIEIFIDINNLLNDIYSEKNYDPYFSQLISNIDELIKFKNKIKDITDLEIMDNCIMFKLVYYNMAKLFPNGKYVGGFCLDEDDAEIWWIKNFGNELFIKNDLFWNKLSEMCPSIANATAFFQSLFFISFDWFYEYVNKSTFNLFLRFFGGWKNIGETWSKIYFHPAHLIMHSSEHGEYELNEIKKLFKNQSSAKYSYIFCLNWRCDEGLWNVIYIDEDLNIVNKLVHSSLLLQEISNTKLYLYPKGTTPIFNSVKRDRMSLPSLPAYAQFSIEDGIYSFPHFSRENTIKAGNCELNSENKEYLPETEIIQNDEIDLKFENLEQKNLVLNCEQKVLIDDDMFAKNEENCRNVENQKCHIQSVT